MMRLVLVLMVITAVGIVAGGFTGKTIAENSLTSSSSAPTDSKKDLLTDYTRLVSSDDPSPQASVNSTGTAPAQQEPPQIFEAPKAEGSSIHETERALRTIPRPPRIARWPRFWPLSRD